MTNEELTIRKGLETFGNAVVTMANHDEFFRHKIQKHKDNPEKIAGYLCYRYSSQPTDAEFKEVYIGEHKPTMSDAKSDKLCMEAVEILKSYGWKIKIGNWPEIGQQIIVIRSDNRCYHSDYKW